MVFKHHYSWIVQSMGREHRAAIRDGVMGIGSGSYVDRQVLSVPKVTTSEQTSSTKQLKTQKPSTLEEDDSGSDIVILSSSTRKRSLSITSTPRQRSKRARTARAMTDEPQLPESETEEDTSEDDSDDDYEEAVDPEAQEKIAKASKEFASACKNCKANANKALKTQHDLQVSKLKSEHKHELREIKAEKATILADTKSKANKEKAKQKSKLESHIEKLKDHRDRKLEDLKNKHEEAAEEWQDKLDSEKKKVKKLTTQRDAAEAKRKDIERSATEDIKTAHNDLKAGEAKLREEKKQMQREKQQEIDLLKPGHSKALKEKDKIIDTFAQKVVLLERDLAARDRSLQRLQTTHDTLQQTHQSLKTALSEKQNHAKSLEKELHDTRRFAGGVEGRADGKLAKLREQIDLREKNVREHSSRVITLQRENHQLRDTLTNVAKLGREKRDELERLKGELQSTKAELGVVREMETMGGGGGFE